MAAESGERRAARFRQLAAEHAAKAENYQRVAERVEKGNAGEHEIARLLDILEGSGWRVLNDRYKSATSKVNIDHILVGPPGVCVIDSKNWKSAPLRIDDRGIALGRYRKDNELGSVAAAAAAVHARATTTLPGVITAPVLAFVADMGLAEPVFQHGVVMLQAGQLLLTQQPPVLTPQQVHQLASALDAAFLPRAGGSKPLTTATLDRYRSPAQSTMAAVASPEARSPAASGRSGRARESSGRSSRRQPRYPVTTSTPYKERGVFGSLVHDAMSWLMRATAVVVLGALLITVGMPLATRFLQYALPKLVAAAASSTVTTPSPSPSVLPLKKTLHPVPQRSS